MNSEKLPPVSSPTEYEVKMKRNGDGQWKIDLNDYNKEHYLSGFIKKYKKQKKTLAS
ncbi:DUF5105 domain-containing protein [Bacillus sp. FJAT-53060]|uniref:DUF5105 domain-containing protein n=1 Tax=Bacillus sp. FJAT-53060 TaxID=3127666 RepID=UPI001CFC0FC0